MKRSKLAKAISSIFPAECIQARNRISDPGTGRSFSIAVTKQESAVCIKIDRCVEPTNQLKKKCDGLCILWREKDNGLLIIMVELKSYNNIDDSIKQFLSTHDYLKTLTRCGVGIHKQTIASLSSVFSQNSFSHGSRILALTFAQGGAPNERQKRRRGIPNPSEIKRRLWQQQKVVFKVTEDTTGLSMDQLFSYAYPKGL